MKNEITGRLTAVLNALEQVSVHGKSNLTNLSGSIALIEEVRNIINQIQFTKPVVEEEKNSTKE